MKGSMQISNKVTQSSQLNESDMSTTLQISPSNLSSITQVPTALPHKVDYRKSASFKKGPRDIASVTLRKGEESIKYKKPPSRVDKSN
jgi:hypothetical protein